MMSVRPFVLLMGAFLSLCEGYGDYGASAFGKLGYPSSFTQFQFTSIKSVPRDGKVVFGTAIPFNSLNPFVVRGTPAPIVAFLCFARLLEDSYDEIGSSYAYLAEDVETAPDYTWVKFRLRKDATFSDGSAITAEDVVFSFNMRCEHNPSMKNYYRNITKVEAIDTHTVVFHCPENVSHEIATILGQLSVLPKAFFANRDPGAPLSEPIPTSGPYMVESFDSGSSLQLKRRPDWWGYEIPSQKGKYNVETLRLNVFRDTTAIVQALLSGDIDLCIETRIKAWEESYKGKPFDEMRVCASELPHKDCGHTYGMFFNLRKPMFQDKRVRQAINLMINGPWLNTNLYQGRYHRNRSYFPNSVLAHKGLPEGEEKAILEAYRSQLPESIWTTAPLEGNEKYNTEERRRQALKLLEEAGWKLENGVLKKGDDVISFSIIINTPAIEKQALHVQNVLKPLGIDVSVRMLDRVVYQEKLDQLDFDMVVELIPQSLTPGNEQMSYWGSTVANTPGTRNYAGIQDPVVDSLCNQLLQASTYEQLCHYVRALDRVLMQGYYMIPCWHFDRLLVGHKPQIRWSTPHSPHQVLRWLFETMWVDKDYKPQPPIKPSLWHRLKGWVGRLF